MGLFSWAVKRQQVDPNADPVGPIGGNQRPGAPTETGPWISSALTWSPPFKSALSKLGGQDVEEQQRIADAPLLPHSPMVGDYSQQVQWPTEETSWAHLPPAPFKDRGPDPRWTPPPSDFGYQGHRRYSFNRPWHLAPLLDGNRTTVAAAQSQLPSMEGSIGTRRPSRATVYAEPGPWSANVVDTTAQTGTTSVPGTPNVISAVHISPDTFPGTNRGSYRLM
jgi:hypothetical protein